MIWTGAEEELLKFINELNQKDKTINLISSIQKQNSIIFWNVLDVLVYEDTNNKLQTTLYKNPYDCQSYLHANSEHPRSLKESTAYSQALLVKRICSTISEFEAHIITIKNQLVKRGYEKTLNENHIEKVAKLDWSVLLAEQSKSKKSSCLSLSVTYKRTLPNIRNILKGELPPNYIFLHFALISLEWDSITLFTKMNFFFLPKLTFQHHLHNIYIYIYICPFI